MSNRFYVYESSGVSIRPSDGLHTYGAGAKITLVHIFDRAYCHREVGRFGVSQEAWTYCGSGLERARVWAERRCAELNAWAEAA